MNLKTSSSLTILATVLAGTVLAQRQSHVPAPDDYAGFSRFVADRNIFNPDRYAHVYGRTPTYHAPNPGRSAPAFSFVGTMVYNKGLFAFFDGNSDEYRKSLQISGKIAGYTIQDITLTNVLLTANSNTVSLAVGAVMRRSRDGTWVPSEAAEDFSTTGNSSSSTPGAETGDTAAPAAAAPAGSSGEMSDVLKRLMKLREQENK